MIDITKLEDISFKLIYNENHKELINIETFLKNEISKADDIMEEEYVLFLYLVVKIKNNPVEIDSINTYFKNYFILIDKSNNLLKNSSELRKLYISNVISHLQYLQKIYSDKYYGITDEKIYILKNNFKKDLFLINGEYSNFFRQLLYKHILGYGRSYFNLMYTAMITWFLFAYIYYINDAYLNHGSLFSSFNGSEGKILGSFDYYLYLSLNTLSNLGADFGLGTTPFLRIMFGIEQMVGVILTGLFVYVLAKKI